jgi:hypothetical protein
MFSRPDYEEAVTDLRALLGTGPEAADTEEPDRARLAELRQAIMSQPRAARRPWPWPARRPGRAPRRRAVVAGLALPVLLGATAAGWALSAAPPASRVADGVACYLQPYLPNHGHHRSGGAYITISSGASPITVCARMWAEADSRARHPYVPGHLIACSMPPDRNANTVTMGGAAVLPDTTCAAVHLPPLPAGWDQAARRIFDLEAALQRVNRHCQTEPVAEAAARRILIQRGFAGWVVTTPWGTTSKMGHGCWEGQADSSAHAVQVLPAP